MISNAVSASASLRLSPAATRARSGRKSLTAIFSKGSFVLYISLKVNNASGGRMSLDGGCACGAIRYRLTAAPMIVHACHCRDCQKLTGSAFVINLWLERKFVEASGAAPVAFSQPPGPSGSPHEIFVCGSCSTQLWSEYHSAPGDTVLLRAGTLDDPSQITPNVHIFTRSKLPWLELPADARVFDAYYRRSEVWSPESLARWREVVAAAAP